MAQITVNLPPLVMTSSAVDTSTQSVPYVDISDAIALTGWVNGATTAPGLIVQISLDGESTAPDFATLLYDSTGSSVVYLTSAARTIPVIAAKRLRVATSNVTSTSYSILFAKSMHV